MTARERSCGRRAAPAGDGPLVTEAGDAAFVVTELTEDLFGVVAGRRRRTPDGSGGPAEAGGRRRLDHPSDVDERLAGDVVGVARSFARSEDRRKTGVGSFHLPAPFVPGAREEDAAQRLFHLRPAALVVLVGERLVVQPNGPQQCGVELRFDGADGDVM